MTTLGQDDPLRREKRPRGNAVLAWAAIALIAVVWIGGRGLLGQEDEAGGVDESLDPGLVTMELQAKTLVGTGSAAMFMDFYLDMLKGGSVAQRQRYVILAGELVGPREALAELELLEKDLDRARLDRDGDVLTEGQLEVQELLHDLFPPRLGDLDEAEARRVAAAAADALDAEQRERLVQRLGWFGELALAREGTADEAARAELLEMSAFVGIVSTLFGLMIVLGFGTGFVLLILLAVLAAMRKIGSGLGAPRPHHAIYAETFALWMALFLGLQIVAGIAPVEPGLRFVVVFAAFFLSLAALAWPVVRGIGWPTVRADIGYTSGRLPVMEPIFGLAGFLATWPLVAIGFILMLLLMAVQAMFATEGQAFAPTGLPSHPIVVEMRGGGFWGKLQVGLLLAVAAPVVEETMFRGVLYRHLRDASATLGLVASVGLSTVIGAFVFAAIHPQGWVAIPPLMALAVGMTLVREWRGSLIGSIAFHGANNGLIWLLLLVLSEM